MAQLPYSHRAPRAVLMVVLGALACDLGVEPPPERPVLAVSAREVTLFATKGSSVPDTASVYFANNGSGSLAGLQVRVVEAPVWLDTALQDTTLLLIGSAGTLDMGTYTATVEAVLETASNSPRSIVVNLRVGASQQIELSASSLTFAGIGGGTTPPAQTLTVSNAGDGTLSELAVLVEYASDTTGWLRDSLVTTVAPTRIVVEPAFLPSPGVYSATVTVSSPIATPASQTAAVELVVAEPPTLTLSASKVEFDAVESEAGRLVRSVQVTEKRRRPLGGLTASVSPEAGWLRDSLDRTSAPATLYVFADTTDLARDSLYESNVTVSSTNGGTRVLDVSLRVRTGPTVELSMDTVRFTLLPNEPLPAPHVVQQVRIHNAGAGILTGLDMATVDPASWLGAVVTTPDTLSLSVDATGVAAGTVDTGTVAVVGLGAVPDTVTVVLQVLDGPSIAPSSDSVTLRADSAGQLPDTIRVWVGNAGEGTLTGLSAEGSEPWLGVKVDPAAPGVLSIWAQTTDLARGIYSDSVALVSVAGIDTVDVEYVAVTYEVRTLFTPPEAAPSQAIQFSSDTVHFVVTSTDGISPTATVDVSNQAPAALTDLKVDERAGWLSVQGPSPADTSPARLRISVDTARATGADTAFIEVEADTVQTGPGSERTISDSIMVVLSVTRPKLNATTERLRFRAHEGQVPWPSAQIVTLLNGGAGALSTVSVADDPAWLDATPSPGPAPIAVSLEPDDPGLSQERSPYGDRVRIESLGALNSPLDIQIEFLVDPGPAIAASPTVVRLSGIVGSSAADSQVVGVWNAGKGAIQDLQAVPEPGAAWLTATLDAAAAPATLTVSATPLDGMTAGTLRGEVWLISEANADTLPIDVTFDVVEPAPQLALSPATLVFHATAGSDVLWDAQPVSVFDRGGAPLGPILANADSAWLSVSVEQSPDTVQVWVRPNTVLSALNSPYAAVVEIWNPTDTIQATVRYEIDLGGAPLIVLSTDNLTFDRPAPPAQTVTITNGGSGTLRELSVREDTGADWLFVLLDSRIAPATLTVAVLPDEAADEEPGATALLVVSGEEGTEPQTVTVYLR